MIPGAWPQRTREVPRIDPVPFDEFTRRSILPEQPVVVRGAVSESAEGVANPDVLCDTYGSVNVRVLLDIPDNFLTDMAHDSFASSPRIFSRQPGSARATQTRCRWTPSLR
jgi:hypothetical protein